jgi:hypothetical protein
MTPVFVSSIIIYIGPGMSGGVLAAIIGILSAFFFSLVAILWYPLKKLVRYIRTKFKRQ